MKLRHVVSGLLIICLPGFGTLCGCTTNNPYTGESQVSRAAIGTGVGAAGGALIGQLIGGNTTGTLIGAGVGALAGGLVGGSMDKQEAMLRQQLVSSGVQVVRVGNDIKLIMPGNITFQNDRADIRPHFYNTLNSVTLVLNKFKNTTIRVAGYASNTGNAMHNQILSEQRARSVARYLVAQGVNPNRVMTVGYGARYAVADNSTLEGQSRNRRVELTIHQINE